MTRPVLLVRLKFGVVSESQRKVHAVPLPDDPHPTELIALCGAKFDDPDSTEFLSAMCGMPCNLCVLATPTPATELPTATEPASP